MKCVPIGVRRGLRWGCLGLAATSVLLAVTNDADARRYRRHQARQAAAQDSYSPPYADIVIDAKSGRVLHEAAADAPRHPASLTKIMTLYLLFERLQSGKISLDTPMPVSEKASQQAPTKLGLKPGETIRVEDAIKGLVTKSANDAAVVVAEALGGSEEEFAKLMTRKARALGMRNTVYHNASGLPDDEQVTTARDQALLGIAIQERFPKYYRYFSLASFVYRGHAIRNHNHLLGRVEGVDGIKTGYTRASGFNLITSVKRGARHIVAVVLGGRSAARRDARMRDLIDDHIAEASTRQTREVAADEQADTAAQPKPQAAAAVAPLPLPPLPAPPFAEDTGPAPEPGSNAPITPLKVKTVKVKVAPAASSAAARSAMPTPVATPPAPSKPETTQAVAVAGAMAPREEAATAAVTPQPSPAPGILGTLPAMMAAAKEAASRELGPAQADADPAPAPQADPIAAARPEPPSPHKAEPAAARESKAASASKPATEFSVPTRPSSRGGGWAIQVGAYEDESEAKQHLGSARSKVTQILRKAEAYIERTVKGAKTYYRARFAGFDRDQAEAACRKLKRDDLDCMATKL